MFDNPWLKVERLLVARLDNAGDVLMCQPALRAIRHRLPACHITLWASPGGAKVACLLPEIDDVLETRAVWQDLGKLPFDPERERDLVQILAEGQYDAVIIFTSFAQSPHPAAYACYLAGIPLRAGQPKDFAGGVLSHLVSPLPDNAHQVDRNLNLVRSLGFEDVSSDLEIQIPDEARDRLGTKLRTKGVGLGVPFVVLHPGASCPSRRYSVERFGEVARLLYTSQHWPVLVSGGEHERGLAATLLDCAGPGAVSLVGETALDEFAALVARATVVITNNTLTMHLADALRTPEVVLFAGTELEEQWQPRNTRSRLLRRPTPCHPCYRFECPYELTCLDIPPTEVASAVLELVAEVPR